MNKKTGYNLILLIFATLIIAICLAEITAMEIDNVVTTPEVIQGSPITLGESQIDYNPLWERYAPIQIDNFFGLGGKLMEGAITKHTDTCGDNCESDLFIANYEESPLIDEMNFYTITYDSNGNEVSRKEEPIRSYQIYYATQRTAKEIKHYQSVCRPNGKYLPNGTLLMDCSDELVYTSIEYLYNWLPYTIGQVMPKGNYYIRIVADKSPKRVVDWVIKSKGKTIDDWAVWGITATIDDHNINMIDTGLGAGGAWGMNITATNTAQVTEVGASFRTSSNPNNMTIYDRNGTMLGSAKINQTTGIANFTALNLWIVNGRGYYVMATANSSGSFDSNRNTTAKSQIVGTNLNWEGAVYNAYVDADMIAAVITNITTLSEGGIITLNSPIEGYNSSSRTISTFNATATITGGATLVNMSVWTNQTGTWKINNTNLLTGTTNNTAFSVTFPSDGYYKWGISACDSDGDCGYSNNRTLLIDSINPAINILYPIGIINNGVVGQNLSLNYSISDINLQTCWREYQGINTTISCLTNSSFILNSSTTLKIWANDTVGNKAYASTSWQYKVFENSRTYNANAYETNNEPYILNITSENSTISISSKLWYDGSSYESNVSKNGYNFIINNTLAVPLVTLDGQNKSFFWELLVYNGTGSYALNTSISNQSVNAIHLEKCNATYTFPAINFTAKNEETLGDIIDFNLKGTFNYWLGSGDTYRNKSIDDSFINGTALCISPSDKTFLIDANIEYGDNNDTYITRDMNLNDYEISNITDNFILYLLEATDSTTFILSVQDTAQNPIPDTYIHIQRYFPGTNTYETVQIVKTNNDGKTVGFYKAETATYRHLLYDSNGTLLLQTVPGKVFAESVPYTIVFTIGETIEIPWNSLEALDGLYSLIGYNNNTKIANFTYADTSGQFTSARFVVEKVWGNQSNQVICNVSSTLASAILTCSLLNYNGSMIGYGYINRGTSTTLVELYPFTISDKKQIFDKTGLFLAWFIMLVAACLFIYNFIVGLWVECGAIILVNFIGLASFPAIFIWGAIAITIITTIIFGREVGQT